MSIELLKESQKTNILITENNVIRTTGNINFHPEDIFHSPDVPRSDLIEEALSAFINGYKNYSKSNGKKSEAI